MTELTCICCPMGCTITVEKKGEEFIVSGNGCPRGKKYAVEELTAPTRTVTSSVKVNGGDKPIAKNLVFDSLKTLEKVVLAAPVHIGDVIVENVLGTGVNFVATREVNKI